MKKVDNKQLSLFDLVLPSNDEQEVKEIVENNRLQSSIESEQLENNQPQYFPESTPIEHDFSMEVPKISMARVPDEEFNFSPNVKIPTVNDLLKLLDKSTFRVSRHEFLSDVFECGAIAISNQVDFRNANRREETYLQIINKYDKGMQQLLAEMFSKIYLILTNQIFNGFADYLGELYMKSETSNGKSGQFFTPYNVSKCCAGMVIDKSKVNSFIEQDKIITLHEPTCGSGGMVLAAADVLYNKYQFNISRNLLVECGDIDRRCVHMAYLQLGLAGIPAVIFHRDGLTLETWDRWETPAYIMQYTRFKNAFKGTPSDWKPKKEG